MAWCERNYESLRNRGNSQRPGNDAPPPPLGQKGFSVAHQLIDVDVVEGEQKEDQHCDTEEDGAGSGIADQWPHQKRSDNRDEQHSMPARRETTVDFFSQLTEKAGLK